MMIDYDDALQKVLDTVIPLHPTMVSLNEAHGLILAFPANAHWDMPCYDNSAMDGYALSSFPEDSRIRLPIKGTSFAGHPYVGELLPGQAIRITTGAVLPPGAKTVIPLEEATDEDGFVYLIVKPKTGQHVRYRGEECHANDVLIEPGTLLRAGEIALLASVGVEQVNVYPRPRVAIISTGDELVDIGQIPGPGQAINSNLHFLRHRLNECGCTPICIGVGADEPDDLGQLIDQALEADVIISTGGVSVGEKDLVQNVLDKRDFHKIFWKVAIKPGNPVLFGMLKDKPYFGLPGNPAATAATFELFTKPALKRLAGLINPLSEKRKAVLANEIIAGGNRQTFLWCKLEWQKNGYNVSVLQHQGSGQNRCLTGINALLPVPTGTKKLVKGEPVEVFLL